MGFAFNSKMVDALVLYVTEDNGKPIYVTKKKEYAALVGQEKNPRPLVAIKYSIKSQELNSDTNEISSELNGLSRHQTSEGMM